MKTPYLKIVDAWMMFSLFFHFVAVILHIIIAYFGENLEPENETAVQIIWTESKNEPELFSKK